MRYGVLSDVHGNGFALRAAVDRLTRAGVDGWLCAGDIVGYGPQPNECVELLAELGARCVAGNHELLVLGRLSLERSGRLARETTPWTRAALRDDSRAFLAGLPLTLRLGDLVMAHGSLTDPERYVTQDAQARAELVALRRVDTAARVLVLGHTHRPWLYHESAGTLPATARPPAGRLLVNPGSVGQSRQRERVPRARFLLLDLEHGEIRFFTEPYDVAGARVALRAAGLPRSGIHVAPGRLRAVPRRARALLRYARRRTGI
jgi:predicted phosphodiesterase